MNFDEFLYYEDGRLIWKFRDRKWFKSDQHYKMWNTRYSNREAGVKSHGYVSVCLFGKRYRAHRIIWNLLNGAIPAGLYIDHINRDRSDNRIENLRLATMSQNAANTVSQGGSSRYKGVSFDKNRNQWLAKCQVNGKQKNLGRYKTEYEAHEAYCLFMRNHHGEYFHS